MTEAEFQRAEEIYGICCPPDWKVVLSQNLPLDLEGTERTRWPDWRNIPNNFIDDVMGWPLHGVLFDVERNNFWFRDWAPRPEDLNEALKVTRLEFAKVPKLLPIFGHRYLACEPYESGNPVFSVWQTDVIYYGTDLLNYLQNEFRQDKYQRRDAGAKPTKYIPFWSWLATGE